MRCIGYPFPKLLSKATAEPWLEPKPFGASHLCHGAVKSRAEPAVAEPRQHYPRLPPQKAQGGLFDLSVFRSPAFTVYALSGFLVYFGVFNMPSYMTSSAVSYGLFSNITFYLVAVSNGSTLLGSVVAGFVSDRLGAMNVLIPVLTTVGIITIIWPFCGTVASLSVVSVLFGVTLGAYGPLTLVPVAAMGGTEDLGRRMGTMTTILGIGTLCGPPLAGLLNSTSLGYKAVGYFSGGIIFLATILLVLARFLAVPGLRAKF
ncbi:MFS general substrate transporter [Mycena venus]|uniref:MFS general substrate transporter n=1 Tax=Mycena venus TaxID=2733690 RepID=A0A8H6YJ02_9AGAR|nr:MFS general substrate transporter [Mycena venus]